MGDGRLVGVLRSARALGFPVSDASVQVLSVLLLVLAAGSNPVRVWRGAVVAALLLARPRRLSDWSVWLAVAAATALYNIANWPVTDNHLWLATYWYAALALSLASPNPTSETRRQARWLLGLTFTLAVVWKIASSDFGSGAFFEYTLLTDPRFRPAASLFGGLDHQVLLRNAATLDGPLQPSLLAGSSGLDLFAGALTIGTLVVEGTIAITSLFPLHRLATIRHAALGAFCFLAYGLAPVGGFGAVLLVLGHAQVVTARGRGAYAMAFFAFILYSAIWNTLVL